MSADDRKNLPPDTRVDELVARYDGFLLDAFGVLNDSERALPGAGAFIERLNAERKSYCVISNDASRSVEDSWRHYNGLGIPLERDRIITSGVLLAGYFSQRGLQDRPCIVLGTEDAQDYVRQAGGRVVPNTDEEASVVVLADDHGYPFLPSVNAVVTVLLRRMERGLETELVLPNPDLIFPRTRGYAVTAGAIAIMIEAVLKLRDPSGSRRFVPLGKPHPPIYDAGFARLGVKDKRRSVMIGDQLVTDVRGAHDFGIDSALILTGVAKRPDLAASSVLPTYVLPDLTA